MMFVEGLLAVTDSSTAAESMSRTVYEFGRLAQLDAPYRALWIGVVVLLFVVGVTAALSRRDSVEQRPGVRLLLLALRLGVLASLVLFFLEPQRRTIRQVVRPSRVLMLVDVSQSMGLQDEGTADMSRLDRVTAAWTHRPILDELRKTHELAVLTFADQLQDVALLSQHAPIRKTSGPGTAGAGRSLIEPANGQAALPDWDRVFLPQGIDTRLGSALQRAMQLHRAQPVAAIVAWTDGASNGGLDPRTAVAAAREREIAVFPVGIGSTKIPINVRVSDVIAPTRVQQRDTFRISAYLQAHGMNGRNVQVQLTRREKTASGPGNLVDSRRLTLGQDGDVASATFEVSDVETGQWTYRVEVEPPPDDSDNEDNVQAVEIEVVDRVSRVLLLAGGPTREFRFVRNLLYRDKHVRVDVLLQSATGPISQDADAILQQFPSTPDEMFRYDALLAFDPDWTRVEQHSLELLETWMAEQGGGLVAVAGPVYTGRWSQAPPMETVRDLYPVQFYRHFSILDDVPDGMQRPSPLEFTQAGREAEFLWLATAPEESEAAWASFPGIYGPWPVKGAKPGAIVYARHGGADAAGGAGQPVFLAEQFYGSGRVIYVGSGELWRLRAIDEGYFERLYTKLVRHVSQGRSVMGSSRSVLLVERDRYLLGDTVLVRARLDASSETASAVPPSVHVMKPDGTPLTFRLESDPSRKNFFWGQFRVDQEGPYRLELAGADGDRPPTRMVQVRVPDRERDRPQRNDAVLSELAQRTGGHYFVGIDAAVGQGSGSPLARSIPDRTETVTVADAPDRQFERTIMTGLFALMAGMLCLEWLVRRLCRLA